MTDTTSTGTSSARLRVVRKLGRGGMADVYLCRLTGVGGFDKPVVAKVVRPEHAEDAEFARMFMEEARLSARLQHPNLIHVYGIEQTGGRLVLMMEYVDGPSFKALLRAAWRAGDADWRHVAALMSDVARGLAHAHGLAAEDGTPLRLVHRDVSLDNILVSREGIPKLIDFGIARAADRGRHTQVGTVKGKLQYMAPEQLDGLDVDHRADIYALGVCLYKALSARNPFPGKTTREIWRQRLAGEFIPLSTHRPDLPAPLLEAVARAMEPDLDARCGSAEELADVLESVALSADPPSTRAARREWVRRHAPLHEEGPEEDPSEGGLSLSLMLRGSYGGLADAGEPSDPTPGAPDGGRGAAGETPGPEPTVE
ncbi:MAG: serine/threonine protein kinase, partial [Deltaproteobacteria bacterium]